MTDYRSFGRWSLTLFILFLVGFAIYSIAQSRLDPRPPLYIGTEKFFATVVAGSEQRAEVFAELSSLSPESAIITAFSSSKRWSVSMREVSFPVDMIWLDEQKRVVNVVREAKATVPSNELLPKRPARYLVELAAQPKEQTFPIGILVNFDEARR